MRKLFKKVDLFFDRLEDKIRGWLSRRPMLYTFVAGVAVVLFWRGVWHTADMFPFLTGPVSIAISVVIMMATGIFVSVFVGDMIIMSGLKKEKKTVDKTEEEVQKEQADVKRIEITLAKIEKGLEDIRREQAIHHSHPHLSHHSLKSKV